MFQQSKAQDEPIAVLQLPRYAADAFTWIVKSHSNESSQQYVYITAHVFDFLFSCLIISSASAFHVAIAGKTSSFAMDPCGE